MASMARLAFPLVAGFWFGLRLMWVSCKLLIPPTHGSARGVRLPAHFCHLHAFSV